MIEGDNLLRRIRRARLLSVPESGVRDPDMLGSVERYTAMVERDFRDFVIRIDFAVEVRLLHILERVFILRLFKQVAVWIFGNQGDVLLTFVFLYTIIRVLYRRICGLSMLLEKFPARKYKMSK